MLRIVYTTHILNFYRCLILLNVILLFFRGVKFFKGSFSGVTFLSDLLSKTFIVLNAGVTFLQDSLFHYMGSPVMG